MTDKDNEEPAPTLREIGLVAKTDTAKAQEMFRKAVQDLLDKCPDHIWSPFADTGRDGPNLIMFQRCGNCGGLIDANGEPYLTAKVERQLSALRKDGE